MNYKMIALQIGDAIKYSATLKNIDLAATSVFNFSCEHFIVSDVNITSDRASRFIDWVFTRTRRCEVFVSRFNASSKKSDGS